MTTITEFLLARIAEDEADAIDRVVLPTEARRSLTVYDAERVHAECAAKRAIIATQSTSKIAAVRNPFILRALAAVYASHPDYQQEWAL